MKKSKFTNIFSTHKIAITCLALCLLLIVPVLIFLYSRESPHSLQRTNDINRAYATRIYKQTGFTDGFTNESSRNSDSGNGLGTFYLQRIYKGKGDTATILTDMNNRLSKIGFTQIYRQDTPIPLINAQCKDVGIYVALVSESADYLVFRFDIYNSQDNSGLPTCPPL